MTEYGINIPSAEYIRNTKSISSTEDLRTSPVLYGSQINLEYDSSRTPPLTSYLRTWSGPVAFRQLIMMLMMMMQILILKHDLAAQTSPLLANKLYF